uniref:(northern house mosquito) hypothetical protein n=1 Tax=Culex pipiens TaxID=7175 RepID=A0A8D8B362_CULPI
MTDSACSFARSPAAIGSIFERESAERSPSLNLNCNFGLSHACLCAVSLFCALRLCATTVVVFVTSGCCFWCYCLRIFSFSHLFFVFVIFSSRSGFLADSSQVCYAAMIIINIL